GRVRKLPGMDAGLLPVSDNRPGDFNVSDSTRYIFVSGGVVSGLGKGITAASLGLLLKSRGFTVAPIKCDMYVNLDAGTMNPTIDGEVFVTDDGLEADQELGHYERYLNQDVGRFN